MSPKRQILYTQSVYVATVSCQARVLQQDVHSKQREASAGKRESSSLELSQAPCEDTAADRRLDSGKQ